MSEQREEGSAVSSSLIIFLLGVAVGATVAILYAPQAGSETRAQIADKAGQLKDKAGELKEQVVTKAGEIKTQVTQKASELRERASEMLARVDDQTAVVETADDGATTASKPAKA